MLKCPLVVALAWSIGRPLAFALGCIALSNLFIPGSWSAWIAPVQALLLFFWMMCSWTPPDGHARLPNLLCYCLGYSYGAMVNCWITLMLTAKYRAHWRSVQALLTTRCWRGCESRGFCIDLRNEVVRAWACFTCVTLSLIGQEHVGPLLVLVWLLGVFFVCCFCWFALFDVTGLSFWSSCLTMTTLAQLHDCHSCNDERSIDQKKKLTQCLFPTPNSKRTRG